MEQTEQEQAEAIAARLKQREGRVYDQTVSVRIKLDPEPPADEADEVYEEALDAYCSGAILEGQLLRLSYAPEYVATYSETQVWTRDGKPLATDDETAEVA